VERQDLEGTDIEVSTEDPLERVAARLKAEVAEALASLRRQAADLRKAAQPIGPGNSTPGTTRV
jgi:hypothetical protein